jgi:putative membrane protein
MHVLRTQNVLPDGFTGQVALAVGLFILGVLVVVVLERLSNRVK